MSKILYIIRGVPGSGKSTLAKRLPGTKISADDYFMDNGEYKFDASKLKEAHKYCQDTCRALMKRGGASIVIHNTFTRKWEYNCYLEMAKEFGYEPIEIIVKSNFRSIHEVPEEKVAEMKERFEYN